MKLSRAETSRRLIRASRGASEPVAREVAIRQHLEESLRTACPHLRHATHGRGRSSVLTNDPDPARTFADDDARVRKEVERKAAGETGGDRLHVEGLAPGRLRRARLPCPLRDWRVPVRRRTSIFGSAGWLRWRARDHTRRYGGPLRIADLRANESGTDEEQGRDHRESCMTHQSLPGLSVRALGRRVLFHMRCSVRVS